ncbi:MAG: glycosyltransferase [Nocardioides sp.]|uniref:glycosyltransferase n=1 Tax=Nocardioides sp. TaxID=35761 RepID=UPI003267B1D6
MPSPVVSVVVPSRGGATRLPILMDALAKQEITDSWEVVVVLDGDIDDSGRVVESYADRLPLRVISRGSTGGVAAALSAGYEAALGDIIVRCDDDLTPRPDFLARHLEWHRQRPADAAPLGVIALTRDTFGDTSYADAYGRPANERALAAAYARPAEQRWMHWAACNSVPKAAYEAVGGFDTSLTFREDSELGLRLANAGVELVIDPALEIEHRGPATDVAARTARAFTSGASTRAFDGRHPTSGHVPADHGLWNRLVARQARRLDSRESAERFGRRVDELLRLTPRPLRGKLVAWAVEAAGVAGRREGTIEWVRATESGESAVIFVPGLSAGGGAEKTALCMATALRDVGFHVTCFTDADVRPSELSTHFGVDLASVEFSRLPEGPRLPARTPQALADIARDRRHLRAMRRTAPDLFINIKYKSALPGAGRRNCYYVHFPHQLEVAPTSRLHYAYLSMTRVLRRAALHPASSTFVDTYAEVMANSDFTATHVLERWGVSATTLYPPCDITSGGLEGTRDRILLNVGRFQAPGENVPHKLQDVLVEAFRQMPDLISQGWRLCLVGALSQSPADRDYHASLAASAADLPVTILENATHTQLAELMTSSSIYWHAQGFGTDSSTHPEAQEHFGISTVEAMGAGLVPLVYATGGPLEVVSAVSPDLAWTTVPELVRRTRILAVDESLDSLRERCSARSADFSRRAFEVRVRDTWRPSFPVFGRDQDTLAGRAARD